MASMCLVNTGLPSPPIPGSTTDNSGVTKQKNVMHWCITLKHAPFSPWLHWTGSRDAAGSPRSLAVDASAVGLPEKQAACLHVCSYTEPEHRRPTSDMRRSQCVWYFTTTVSTTCIHHRRRLLEITVGQDSPSHSPPPTYLLPPPLPLLLPCYSSLFSHVHLTLLSPSCLFPFPCPTCRLYPLNPARVWGGGGTVSSRSGFGQRPDAKRFWCIFWNQSTFCHFHNDTFVSFTQNFGCVQLR